MFKLVQNKVKGRNCPGKSYDKDDKHSKATRCIWDCHVDKTLEFYQRKLKRRTKKKDIDLITSKGLISNLITSGESTSKLVKDFDWYSYFFFLKIAIRHYIYIGFLILHQLGNSNKRNKRKYNFFVINRIT